ncbi:hypothetical protein PCANC_00876 [Puccinia coronata f. sp. avenae]|uniref:Uncharacterized protein n=1 Tax=Puccinia coronata f. sp. avenae TaxID=200324 RepID=A0A2N5W7Q2_9BASI|nr:hypothetical protein PCANC_00876 [Puccinia coronata f. sp. avenae]
MTKELSCLLNSHNGTFWDHSVNHQCCFCHVLAPILGEGLSALKLLMAKAPTAQKPEHFPILETINEECEIIDNGAKKYDKEEETNLNNVTDSGKEEDSTDENSHTVSKKSKGKYAAIGIGFTLKRLTTFAVVLQARLRNKLNLRRGPKSLGMKDQVSLEGTA